MTTIIYNDVILRDCETLAFDQEVKLDESGTDVLYSKFNIRVASNVTATRGTAVTPFGVAAPLGSTVVERMADVHARLSEVRKDFWMLIDDAVVNEVTGSSPLDQVMLIATGITAGTVLTHPLSDQVGATTPIARSAILDCNNGPKVKNVSVQKIVGGRGMRVEVEFEVCRKICVPGFTDAVPNVVGYLAADSRVLSNRWRIDESKDENWVTTRVMQGTLRVAHSSFWPHGMRLLCVPSLLKGYKRVRQSYVDDPTNLVLKYRIEDRQAHAAPPTPAVAWSGHHVETSTNAGTIQGAQVQVRLTGAPGVDKLALIGTAGRVIASRIQGLIPERNADGELVRSSTILQNAVLMDVMNEPTIEMRVQVRYSEPDYKFLAMRVKTMGASMDNLRSNSDSRFSIAGYFPRHWPVPLPYDSARPAGIFSCYLQHPCSVWHDVPGGLPPGSTEIAEPVRPDYGDADEADPGEQYTSPGYLPDDDTEFKPQASGVLDVYSFPYSHVEIQNRYVTNHGWAQLPLADTYVNADKTAALVRLHGSVTRRILTMTASREGRFPVIPSLADDQPDPNGIREVLADDEIELLAPQMYPGGVGRTYAVRLLRTYLLERAPRSNEKLRSGASPLDKFSASKHWMDLAAYADTQNHLQ